MEACSQCVCVSLGVSLSIFLALTLWSGACYHSNIEEEVMLLESQKIVLSFSDTHSRARTHAHMLLLGLSCAYTHRQAVVSVFICVCPVQLVHAGRQKAYRHTRAERRREAEGKAGQAECCSRVDEVM